jgi:replicative DNA helicase
VTAVNAPLPPLVPLPPQNLEAEEHVLGAMMLSPQAIEVVSGIIDATDFHRESHAKIYRAALDLFQHGHPVEAITVADKLDELGQLEAVGGKERIREIATLVPAATNAGHYARIVREMSELRGLIAVGERIQRLGMERPGSVSGLVTRAEGMFSEFKRTTTATDAEPQSHRTVDGWTFIHGGAEKPRALWGDGDAILWAQGEGAMVFGPDGTGKTSVVQQLLLKRLFGGDLLGLPVVPAPGKVLYLAADRPAQAARSMHRMVSDEHEQTLRERLVVHRGPLPFEITEEPSWTLRQWIESHDACELYIDSLYGILPRLTEDEVGSAFGRAIQDIVTAGLEVMVLHHPRKQQQGGPPPKTLADVYGSRWITACLGSVVVLWGNAGDPIVDFKHLKQPIEEVGPFRVQHDHVRGVSSVHGHVDFDELLATGGTTGLTVKTVALALYQSDDRNAIEKARRKCEAHVCKGIAERGDPDPEGAIRYRLRWEAA